METVVAGYGHARVPVTGSIDPDVTVTGDQDALRRIVVNLVDNAVRYAAEGVTLTLTTGARAAGRRPC